MEKLVTQVNDFSRKRLLIRLLPLTVCLFIICCYLHSSLLFTNLFSLIAILWLTHPYLVNFEKETIDYFKYLKDQEIYYQQLIDKKKRKLKKCKKIKPLDLSHDRKEFIRLTESLKHNQKEVSGYSDNYFCSDFQRDLKRKIIMINDFAILKKKLIIKYLKEDIRDLEEKKSHIINTEHFVLQEAIPRG